MAAWQTDGHGLGHVTMEGWQEHCAFGKQCKTLVATGRRRYNLVVEVMGRGSYRLTSTTTYRQACAPSSLTSYFRPMFY